jgi:hypothetical protein
MIDRTRMQFVAASLEDKEIAYLRRHNVVADFVVHLASVVPYPISGTPTLVIVDNEGKVRHSWVGLIDERREQEVKNAILSN